MSGGLTALWRLWQSCVSEAKVVGMNLETQLRERGTVAVLELRGRITIGDGVAALRKAVEQALGRSPRLVLEMSAVDYLDSAGLGEIVASFNAAVANGGSLKLAKLSRRLQELLHVTRTSKLLEVHPGEEEAVASFG